MMNIKEELQAPFREDEYEWRVQSETKKGDKVSVLCYVQARAIQNRLDDTVGPFGWKTEYVTGPGGGVICRLSVKDPESGEWVTKEDGAENTQIEAVKGGISGALKRAGSAWGIGRLLYNLEANYVELKDGGKHWHKCKDGSFKYWDAPKLPDWALPNPPVNISKLKAGFAAWITKDNLTTASAALDNLRKVHTVQPEAEKFIKDEFSKLDAA